MTQPSTDIGRIALAGAQTIRNADDAGARLLATLAGHSTVEIDCSATSEIDLSIVQLILAARKSALAAGKNLLLAQTATGVLHDVLMRGGFLHADPAAPRTDEQAFWLREASAP